MRGTGEALKYFDNSPTLVYTSLTNQPHKTFKKQCQSPTIRVGIEWRAYQTNHNCNERSWAGDMVRLFVCGRKISVMGALTASGKEKVSATDLV